MNKYFGYCRISTPKQSIDRQVRNILAAYPQAEIIKEIYTGRKFQGRKEFDRLMRKITPGDTIIFDSVSRMSRDAEEGFIMYEELYHKGINLIFLKEPHISTETYKKALQGGIPATGTDIDCILEGINKYLLLLAKEQIRLAFEQSEKEVHDFTSKNTRRHPDRPTCREADRTDSGTETRYQEINRCKRNHSEAQQSFWRLSE